MVHGVSDQAIMSSPEGPNKVDHGDSVTACVSKKSCVEEEPFTSQTTENRNRNKPIPTFVVSNPSEVTHPPKPNTGKCF